jgi:hypothetical protein
VFPEDLEIPEDLEYPEYLDYLNLVFPEDLEILDFLGRQGQVILSKNFHSISTYFHHKHKLH